MANDLFNKENNGASFSEDKQYRYSLWRIWDETKPLVMFIGLNPSNANAEDDDPTIRCVIKFCQQWGYGGFYMMNCFAFVSSKPEFIKRNPMSDEWNNNMLTVTASKCKDVVFAWGKFQIIKDAGRDAELIEMFPNAFCIGRKDGFPFHPLWAGVYAPKDLKLTFTQPVKFIQ